MSKNKGKQTEEKEVLPEKVETVLEKTAISQELPKKTDETPKEKKPSYTQLVKEIEKLKEELATAKNDYYKAYADTENLKKRLQNEQTLIIKYRATELAMDILPGIDNLERALSEADPEDPLAKGVKMVYDQLLNSLKKEGVEVIEALHKPFDANLHHAIMTEKVKGVKPGIVIAELQKGYMLKDRILRASLVKVSE